MFSTNENGKKTMFRGSYTHKLDSKNRIRIPAEYKKLLGDDYVVTKGPIPGVIFIYPMEVYTEMTEKLFSKLSAYSKDFAVFKRQYFQGQFNSEEDSQGRLLLKEDARTYAHIKKEVISYGVYDHVELCGVDDSKVSENYDFENIMKLAEKIDRNESLDDIFTNK